jgi:hypothetical protein
VRKGRRRHNVARALRERMPVDMTMTMTMGLEHRQDPRIMLVHGGRRRHLHRLHTILIQLASIPHLAGAVLMTGVHVLCTHQLVVLVLFHILPDDDLELCTEDDAEAVSADGLVDAGDAAALAPFVEFTAEGVCFEFEETEFAGGEEAVAPGSVYVGDGGVDDGGFGRTTDLGKVWEKGCQVLKWLY